MRSILVILLLGLAWQSSLAKARNNAHYFYDEFLGANEAPVLPRRVYSTEPRNVVEIGPSSLDPILSKLEDVKTYEEHQTDMVLTMVKYSYDKILERLTNIEKQIEGLQKPATPVECTEKSTKGPEIKVSEEAEERLLKDFEKIIQKYCRIEDDEPLGWSDALAQ